jgi:L-fucose isomerase-like protein
MINAKLLAFHGAPENIFKEGKQKFKQLFPDIEFEYYSPEPDLLVFLSGGSEQEALRYISDKHFYLLTAFEENNSYAAASEIKAFLDQKNIPAMLTDLHEPHDRMIIQRFFDACQGIQKLPGKNLGLIGEVSPWLLASTIEAPVLKNKLGINLKKISWAQVSDYTGFNPDAEFLKKFSGPEQKAIQDAGRVHEALKQVAEREKLDALTIECFPLVQQREVSACLSLSHFNDQGIPAGCEGDICSAAGMMFIQAITGSIPWMANLIKVSTDCVRLAHCTAPTSLLEEVDIDSHYETGKSVAVSGKFHFGNVTLLRFSNDLNRVFISEGKIISNHKSSHACRTQIEVNIAGQDAECLKHHPLGNHHLVLPGQYKSLLKMACKVVGVSMINR